MSVVEVEDENIIKEASKEKLSEWSTHLLEDASKDNEAILKKLDMEEFPDKKPPKFDRHC